jgi:hypothetical protein
MSYAEKFSSPEGNGTIHERFVTFRDAWLATRT